MRFDRYIACAMALMLGTSSAVASTPHVGNGCALADERDALEIKKLSSELMVTSETCHTTDRYNAYIRHYQGALTGNEKVLGVYFKRNYGRTYQKSYDDFATDLANVQMQQGLNSGTAFCGLLSEVFDEVMVLDGPQELADFARSKPMAMPIHAVACAEPKAKSTKKKYTKKKHA